jgi:hypothetical protein
MNFSIPEVTDTNTNHASYYASGVENSDGGAQQNSPKRQRTGREGGENATGTNGNVSGNNEGEEISNHLIREAVTLTVKKREGCCCQFHKYF